MAVTLPTIPPPLAARGIALRPRVEADQPFLAGLYRSTRWEELEPTGWPDATKVAFLDQQFTFQTAHYARAYPGAAHGVILHHGAAAGRLILDLLPPDDLRVVDITLLPAHRGQGIGTALFGLLFEMARAAGHGVSIHVETVNPARHLYRRLGFVEATDEGAVYLRMDWRPEGDQLKTA